MNREAIAQRGSEIDTYLAKRLLLLCLRKRPSLLKNSFVEFNAEENRQIFLSCDKISWQFACKTW